MKTIIENPSRPEWSSLTDRPVIEQSDLNGIVSSILREVKERGDEALEEYTRKFDGVSGPLLAGRGDLENASHDVSTDLKEAIELARSNIEKFHRSQRRESEVVETQKGVECWRRHIPLERVGLYIPNGLFSTLLMLGIPAKIAGCREVIICSPPSPATGAVSREILYVANLLGFNKVFSVGGAQAVAALSSGTKSIPRVDKIFGPGNQYVTAAKQLVSVSGTAIDMPAGPSELLIIADDTSVPEFVAADLLSQAEHSFDSQVVLVTTSKRLAQSALQELENQLEGLPRKEMAKSSLESSRFIVVKDLEEAIDFSNMYAPEHLMLCTSNAPELSELVINAGSVFVGNYSAESLGDYASGTNHTLPTNGWARVYGGVSLDSFMKAVTFQHINAEGVRRIGKAVETMASGEGLEGHKRAVSVRLRSIGYE